MGQQSITPQDCPRETVPVGSNEAMGVAAEVIARPRLQCSRID